MWATLHARTRQRSELFCALIVRHNEADVRNRILLKELAKKHVERVDRRRAPRRSHIIVVHCRRAVENDIKVAHNAALNQLARRGR